MGVEPTTPALRKRCSAIELLRRYGQRPLERQRQPRPKYDATMLALQGLGGPRGPVSGHGRPPKSLFVKQADEPVDQLPHRGAPVPAAHAAGEVAGGIV